MAERIYAKVTHAGSNEYGGNLDVDGVYAESSLVDGEIRPIHLSLCGKGKTSSCGLWMSKDLAMS